MPLKNYQEIIALKIIEIKAGIANGSILAQPEWDLNETFDFFIEPFYQSVLSVNGTISVILHLLVFWLIIYRTPKEMKDYKLFLLNIAICSLIHDLQLTVYWKPVPIFPVTAAFVAGPSKIIGDLGGHYGMVSCIMLVTVYMCSMVCGFIYRLVSLLDTFWYRLMMSWIGFGFFVIFHAAPVILLGTMMSLCYVDSDYIRAKALKV
uniref:Uncharacterized protein n=1 Tax=Panagrolaimus davidi TaxID=227884 RepID=A0A914PX62_9BILA